MKGTDLEAWDKHFEGYDSNEEYTDIDNNYKLIIDNDIKTWEEVLEALCRFKLDCIDKWSKKAQ